MKKLIFDPLEEYRDHFKPQHNDNVTTFFDELVKKSQVNIPENDNTVKIINTLKSKLENTKGELSKQRGLKGFLIFLIIVFFIVATIFIYNAAIGIESTINLSIPLLVMFGILSIGLAILFIVLISKKINPKIKEAKDVVNKLNRELQEKQKEAWNQMHTLNEMLDATMTPMLVQKTIPLLEMDPFFDSRRFDYLNSKYGLSDLTNVNESALFVQSGQIQGNPFVLSKSIYMNMGTKTYTGSIVVSYQVSTYVNGKRQTTTRTETLTASVTKPCPYYGNDTILVYGNEAAPNLSFNRFPQIDLNWTKNSLERFVKKEVAEMRKLTDKGIKKGSNFTPLGNSEFEAMFNAYNRDNELEYRLMFTALGQSEISDLIKDKTVGFGDDFEFHKSKNINIIRSRHSQSFDYSATPERYYHYDNKVIRKNFIDYNNSYLRNFYFNMAPVLAVPLYQQHKPQEFIYKTNYQSHLSFYEHEATVNQFPENELKHPESSTQNILKTRVIAKGIDFDTIGITSHGFKTVSHTALIPRTAGNGRVHMVPVVWIEYIPVEQETTANIKVLDEETRTKIMHGNVLNDVSEYLNKYTKGGQPVTSRHVMAFLLLDKFSNQDNDNLDKIIKEKNNK